MIVTTTYSSQLRDRMTPEDWEAIRTAGPGEVRFSRGFGGSFCCTVRVGGRTPDGAYTNTIVTGSDRTSPRAAFDAALADLRPETVSVLRG
jgi:hypothetical protein